MPGWEDYYKILGVAPDADENTIKRAYLDKTFILHPDRMAGIPESARRKAEDELKKVNQAYQILGNPVSRRKYLQEWLIRSGRMQASPYQPPPEYDTPPNPQHSQSSRYRDPDISFRERSPHYRKYTKPVNQSSRKSILVGLLIGIPLIVILALVAISFWPENTHNSPIGAVMKWSYTAGDAILSSPTVSADGTIYVGSYDKKLYAINPDGTIKWSYTTDDAVMSSPAVGADGTIYVGSFDKKLYAINPDGIVKWSYDADDGIDSSPAIGADGTIYVGSYDKKLYAINPDGTIKWSYTTGDAIWSSPMVGADGTIYVGSCDKKLYAINPDGTIKWSYTTAGKIWSSPTVDTDGTVYVGSDDGNLYAINPDGTIKWSYATGDKIWSSPTVGADGTIYVGSQDGKLYAIGAG